MGDEKVDEFYKMIQQSLSENGQFNMSTVQPNSNNLLTTTAGNPYDITTASNISSSHGVDYYMAYAQQNLLQIQEIINHDVIAQVGEDAMKKRIKKDVAARLVDYIVENKTVFTAQDNLTDLTRIVRAKTYVFTHDELVKFVQNIIK